MLRDLASLARKTRSAEREPSSALHALSSYNSAVLHLSGTRVLERNEICSRSDLQTPLCRRLYILDEAAVVWARDRQVAGGLGFEPRLAESESAVLPLDDPPMFTNRINHLSFTVVAKFYSLCPDVHSLGSPLVRPSSRPTAALARRFWSAKRL